LAARVSQLIFLWEFAGEFPGKYFLNFQKFFRELIKLIFREQIFKAFSIRVLKGFLEGFLQ